MPLVQYVNSGLGAWHVTERYHHCMLTLSSLHPQTRHIQAQTGRLRLMLWVLPSEGNRCVYTQLLHNSILTDGRKFIVLSFSLPISLLSLWTSFLPHRSFISRFSLPSSYSLLSVSPHTCDFFFKFAVCQGKKRHVQILKHPLISISTVAGFLITSVWSG